MIQVVAWMGGSLPKRYSEISPDEKKLVKHLFREQYSIFLEFWKFPPDKGTAKVFWWRARGDAHATFREGGYHD